MARQLGSSLLKSISSGGTIEVEFVDNKARVDIENINQSIAKISEVVTGDNTITSHVPDLAEYGIWYDNNTNAENRNGYFITLEPDTNRIKIATSNDVIVGVTTNSAGIISNYSKLVENNSSYGLVGVLGKFTVRDYGRCTVGGRCMPDNDGTAIVSSNNYGYLVTERIDSDNVRILVLPSTDVIQKISEDVKYVEKIAHGVDVGTETPNNSNTKLWIDTSSSEMLNIPEINDGTVSNDDTWSSSKIKSIISVSESTLMIEF